MLNTPPRTSKPYLLSDFQFTHTHQLPLSSLTSPTHQALDQRLTPKRTSVFMPLKDRLLPKNEFKVIKNNRARLIDWFLEIFSAYGLGWECFWMAV